MSGYEITCTFAALCPCCGKELPSSAYLTESKATGNPLERDNPYARKDRRVFIAPCTDCFKPAVHVQELLAALKACEAALSWVVDQGGGPECEHEGGVVCFCRENNAINLARAAIAKTTG